MKPQPDDKDQSEKMVDLKDLSQKMEKVPSFIVNSLEKFLGLSRLNVAYDKIVRAKRMGSHENFFHLATRYLNLRYQLSPGDLENIPAKGPVIVVANHPHGMADGLMFGDILTRRRSDIRLVVNEQLSVVKEMMPWTIKVDVYEGANAQRKNIGGIRKMLAWLKKGGLIAIFPAGSASSYSMKDGHVTDDPWNVNFASLIRHTNATVVPVYFPGRNSLLFQAISVINRAARVAFLPREVGRDGRRIHKIKIGKPISPGQLSQFESDEALVAHLRLRTYLLGKNYEKKRRPFGLKKRRTEEITDLPQVIPALNVDLLKGEIAALPEEQLLVNKSRWRVYYASADQIPYLLLEIGRLRELAFRAIGTGAGSSCDLDDYDQYYHHLFLWDAEADQLVGAYRMGLTDKIVEKYGKQGLYNCKFFDMADQALSKIVPGLEMGRAFIAETYQKKPLSLGLLWEGIGQFIARYPHYRYLFGTVTISGEYTTLSHSLIVQFLKQYAMDEELASYVRSKTPPRKNKLKSSEEHIFPLGVTDLQDLANIVSEIEDDGKGIPVLLRQYLKLNGKIFAFSIDYDFGQVLDCLLVVDIYKSPERSIRRFLGDDTYEKIKQFMIDEDAEK